MPTVLIVDDVHTERQLLGTVVSRAGLSPVYASDGNEGILRAKEIKPDLILMDVVMPNLDGFAACRKLKKDPETASIPIVFVTGKSTESDKFWGEKQGGNAHIGKPFSPEAITSVLRRFVKM